MNISKLSKLHFEHYFDFLGTGWTKVHHGMSCAGIEDHRYPSVPLYGNLAETRINPANRPISASILQLLPPDYELIDWQLDFKSGYRWSENIWYHDIQYGHAPGVDVKIPWELSRMQHLPQFAWAFALAKNGTSDFCDPSAYSKEFRNQVLDFIASNPPRYGVNWKCTMDVAIRAANWLLTYDLFAAFKAEFDEDFRQVFFQSIYEHGVHIFENLEWDPLLRANHYLSDLVGLLYVAAYLPSSRETNLWLAVAIQEFLREIELQFNPDGSSFEASTSYHRLSAELLVYGAALIQALPPERVSALRGLEMSSWKHPFLILCSVDPVFSEDFYRKLGRISEFTKTILKPNHQIPQMGDNDNGRLFKLQPVYSKELTEDILDHRHLVGAYRGLISPTEESVDSWIVHSLTNRKTSSIPREDGPAHWTAKSFPDFGLFIHRSERVYLAIRCGSVGQNGNGGHAHNDALSFELNVDGLDFFVDPGTYLYTPLPERRNLFRSTRMHNTLMYRNLEQNPWHDGRIGLFSLQNQVKVCCLEFNPTQFSAEIKTPEYSHRRILEYSGHLISGKDECPHAGQKEVYFHFSPEVTVDKSPEKLVLTRGATQLTLQSAEKFRVESSWYSAGYGMIQKNQVGILKFDSPAIEWQIEISPGS